MESSFVPAAMSPTAETQPQNALTLPGAAALEGNQSPCATEGSLHTSAKAELICIYGSLSHSPSQVQPALSRGAVAGDHRA